MLTRLVRVARAPLQFAAVHTHFIGPLGLILALGTPGGSAAPPDPVGAHMIADSRRGAMIIELAPVDLPAHASHHEVAQPPVAMLRVPAGGWIYGFQDRKSTRLNSSHGYNSYAGFFF